MRKISSSQPVPLRSCTDSPEQNSQRLISNGHCRMSVHTEDDTVTQFTALSWIRNAAFFKKDRMVIVEHCSILVAFFFQISIATSLLSGRLLRIWLLWMTFSDFIHICLLMFGVGLLCPGILRPTVILAEPWDKCAVFLPEALVFFFNKGQPS